MRVRGNFFAFRDNEIDLSNAAREFSEPACVIGELLPVSNSRFSGRFNDFGAERTTTHTLRIMNRSDLDAYTYFQAKGRWYKVDSMIESDNGRWLSVSLSLDKAETGLSDLQKAIFDQ